VVVIQFVKKSEENAFQAVEHVTTNKKISLEDMYKMTEQEQLNYVKNVIE
jgi:hypothetical protein